VKFSSQDIIQIVNTYKKHPHIKTIEDLALAYGVQFGAITKVLDDYPETAPMIVILRQKNKRSIHEANERIKQKIYEQRQNRKNRRTSQWIIPSTISKSMLLKTTPEQEKILAETSYKIRGFFAYTLETEARKINPSYETVKKFLQKSDALPAKTLDVIQRTKVKSTIQASIRNARLEKVVIPFQGSHGNTSGNAKVISKNDTFYLRINKNDFEILFQEEDDYYDSRIEIPLRKLFEAGETPSGEIIQAKNKKWYVRFSLKRKEPLTTFDENGKKIFLIIQPTFTEIGCKWLAYCYNENNEQIFKTTILKDVAWIRIPHTEKGYITYYTRKAVNNLMEKTWHKRFQTMKPTVILLDAIGKSPSPEVANLNPIFKFKLMTSDKLAEYNGDGYTLENCVNNIMEVRNRLSL